MSQDLKVGTGTEVTAASTLKVNYVGVACSTGKIFDSSYKTQKPATFALAKSIPGFRDGLVGMKVGGERLLGIPSAQGYGTKGRAPLVAPDEPLWFVIDVLDSKAA